MTDGDLVSLVADQRTLLPKQHEVLDCVLPWRRANVGA